MKTYVVVEGPPDATLIARLLPPEVGQHTAVVPAGGRGNLTSVARTLLVTRRKPVAVLIDADAVDATSAEHTRLETEELIRAVAGGVPFKVFVIAPDLDTLLFEVPAALERVTGRPLSAGTVALARYEPQLAIRQLGLEKLALVERVAAALTAEEVIAVRAVSPVRELVEFLLTNTVFEPLPA